MASAKFPRHLPKYKYLRREVILRAMDYDPETGIFTWKIRSDVSRQGWNTRYASKEAGEIYGRGYVRVSLKINDKKYRYLAHILAWVVMTGNLPENILDHRNTNKADNKWKNIREATTSQNSQNQGIIKTNTSGYRGVGWFKPKGKWRARLIYLGTEYHLGYFSSKEEAVKVYEDKAKELHGEFFYNLTQDD